VKNNAKAMQTWSEIRSREVQVRYKIKSKGGKMGSNCRGSYLETWNCKRLKGVPRVGKRHMAFRRNKSWWEKEPQGTRRGILIVGGRER